MRVLMLSTDQKILEEGSDARARMLEYASMFDELHILLIVKQFKVTSLKFKVNDKLTVQKIGFWRACTWTPGVQVEYDVVTAQDPFEIGFVGWRIAQKLGARLQLQIHTDFLSPYFTKYFVLNWIRVKIAKFLLPKADSIRVVSERIKESLTTYGLTAPIIVLPVFVDLEKLRNAETKTDLRKTYPQFEKIILVVSRITKEKNIGLAIDAMCEVVKQSPKVGMIIVGEGPELSALKLQTKNYKLKTNVIFEPWTNDVASYYKTADLFLNTSRYEGYGRTLLEAAVCGLPIVSTDVGIIREVGGVIVGWSSAEVALGIVQTLQNPQKPTLPNLPSKQQYLQTYARIRTH